MAKAKGRRRVRGSAIGVISTAMELGGVGILVDGASQPLSALYSQVATGPRSAIPGTLGAVGRSAFNNIFPAAGLIIGGEIVKKVSQGIGTDRLLKFRLGKHTIKVLG